MKKINERSYLNMNRISTLCLYLALALISVFMVNCKSTQSAYVGKELKLPCEGKKFQADKKYFRASQMATSSDLSLSKEKALMITKQRLASNIETLMKSVTDRYAREMEVSDVKEFEQDYENESREVVRLSMRDVVVICESTNVLKDGNFRTFMSIELDKELFLSGLEKKINKNDRLKLEYDQHRFNEIFEEEMEKLESEMDINTTSRNVNERN